jgi:serine/threonine protein phosphatase PrpC
MEVLLSHLTDCGRVRKGNEDSILYVGDPAGQRGHLLVVADGMGGAEAGEVASRIAVETIAEVYANGTASPVDVLADAFAQANQRIYRTARDQPGARGMGTTCTALVLHEHTAYVGHVGDSRAYWAHADQFVRLTRVHSEWAERVCTGDTTPADNRCRNILTRALGTDLDLTPDITTHPDVCAGDTFILCSDGLWGLVTDPEIRAAVQTSELPTACAELIALANARGGTDNITVAIARISA